jgi:hypothetical protein
MLAAGEAGMKTILMFVASLAAGIVAGHELYKTGYHPLHPLSDQEVSHLQWCEKINHRNVGCPGFERRWGSTFDK